jgi:hypothetical protein
MAALAIEEPIFAVLILWAGFRFLLFFSVLVAMTCADGFVDSESCNYSVPN